ncbi:MAG TPA: hypothetical protein VHO06_09320 [Polyangia bacterium]|nr:hypothetical protein [Polyangia bacterium]
MVSFRGWRRPPSLLFALLALGLALSWQAVARADNNDLNLLNLCATSGGANSCLADPKSADYVDTQSRFRSLMSELGVVAAPRLLTPADTLGYAGFQFSAELGVTTVNNNRKVNGDASGISYWDGVEGVSAADRQAARPSSSLTTVGGFVRKGLWFPLPAVEFGAGAVDILGSHMYAIQGYAKIALQEGFHDWVLPSFAVRGSASQLLGTSQVNLTVWGIDVIASKAFSIGGTARIEPFLGWNVLLIDARSGVIDATPGCDAYAQHLATAGAGATPPGCLAANDGTWNDLANNFTFAPESLITRYRYYGGFKLKLATVFVAGEFDFVQAGSSTSNENGVGTIDSSGSQETFSLSAGLDF